MENEKFDQWCIVELMGHQRMAGRVTEQVVGGSSFVRVDVPAVNGNAPFTRLLGSAAIYAINPVTEQVALAAAGRFRSEPITAFDIPALRQRELLAGEPEDIDDEIPF